MKVAHKIALTSSLLIVLSFSLFSWYQYSTISSQIYKQTEQNTREATALLSDKISNWLNGKLALIDLMAQEIDRDFSPQRVHEVFQSNVLKEEFILIFGGLESTGGAKISNDPSWNPSNWDARKRPWYSYAQSHRQAVLTEPYADAATNEILISAVTKITDNGQFKGAFGGDISLKTVADAINTIQFNGNGYAFLINKNGTIISHPEVALNGKRIDQLFTEATPEFTNNLQHLTVNNTGVYTLFTPVSGLESSNWMIGTVLQEDAVMAMAEAIGTKAIIASIVSAIICAGILAYLIAQHLQPLQQVRKSLIEINQGQGDLTQRIHVKSNDEFGDLSREFNAFLGFLQTFIRSAKTMSSDIRDNTHLTSGSAKQAANELKAQLSELDQLNAGMGEMSIAASTIASSAQQTAGSAQEAEQVSRKGEAIVSQTTSSIHRLSGDMQTAVEQINQVTNYSDNIESILTVITGIAEQTNLLALNAAIEAARAGDMGRGFAVVAEEVRALATRTQDSTEEISNMIQQLQTAVKEVVNTMNTALETANQTHTVASDADDVLSTIRAQVQKISDMSVEIAAAASEQSASTEEINRNTSNIRALSESVSSGANDATRICDKMVDSTNHQQAELARFTV